MASEDGQGEACRDEGESGCVVQVAREAEVVEQAVQVMLEESERSRAAEVEASVKEAVTLY